MTFLLCSLESTGNKSHELHGSTENAKQGNINIRHKMAWPYTALNTVAQITVRNIVDFFRVSILCIRKLIKSDVCWFVIITGWGQPGTSRYILLQCLGRLSLLPSMEWQNVYQLSYRQTHNPSCLALSESWHLLGTVVYSSNEPDTLAVTLSWWQHHEHCISVLFGFYYSRRR